MMRGDFLDLTTFLSNNIYIVSAVLFVIGLFLKQTPKIQNWWIPYILSVISIIICIIILGPSINAILQGFIATGVAVYVHQLGKQCTNCINKEQQ